MGVLVTDTRTVVDQGDNAGNWTGGALNTTDFAEATGSISAANNINALSIFWSSTAVNLTGQIVYVWSANNATQPAWLQSGTTSPNTPPHALLLGDGTNQIWANMAGNDRIVFQHNTTQTLFQCLCMDTDELVAWSGLSRVVNFAGSLGSLNLASITQIGGHYETLSKALAGGSNNFADIIRFGNSGLTISSGSSGNTGKFTEVVAQDKSKSDGKAGGIIREYTTGIFGLQGSLSWGSTAHTSWFNDDGVVIAVEDRPIGNDKLFFRLIASSGTETHHVLTNSTVTTAGPALTLNYSAPNIDELTLSNNSYIALSGTVSFANDTSFTSAHTVSNNTFNESGQIDPGTVTFDGNNINNTTDANGGLLLDDDGSDNLSNLTFNSDGTGHAIYITATGTHEFNNFIFNGYGASGSTDAALFNDSGGAVIINVVGGSTPTFRDGVGASTTVNNNVGVILTGLTDNTEVRIYAAGTQTELAGIEIATDGITGSRSFSFSLQAATLVDIHIHNVSYVFIRIADFIMPDNNTTLPIVQTFDRNYSNN